MIYIRNMHILLHQKTECWCGYSLSTTMTIFIESLSCLSFRCLLWQNDWDKYPLWQIPPWTLWLLLDPQCTDRVQRYAIYNNANYWTEDPATDSIFSHTIFDFVEQTKLINYNIVYQKIAGNWHTVNWTMFTYTLAEKCNESICWYTNRRQGTEKRNLKLYIYRYSSHNRFWSGIADVIAVIRCVNQKKKAHKWMNRKKAHCERAKKKRRSWQKPHTVMRKSNQRNKDDSYKSICGIDWASRREREKTRVRTLDQLYCYRIWPNIG